MRRFTVVLLSLLFTLTAVAQEQGNLSPLAAKIRLGRAMILQPAQPLSDADRAELAAKGIQVRHALAGGRLLVRVKEGAKLEDARIASIEPLAGRHKVHPSARRAAAYGKKVRIIFQRDVTFEDARAAVLAAGGALENPFATKLDLSDRLTASLAPAAVEALAADERVLGVIGSREWKTTTDNATSAIVSRVPQVHAAPYGLTGAGVTLSLFELGRGQADHVEFPNGRFIVHAEGGGKDQKDHATHVAGTMGAAGVNPQAKGMAPNATIHQFCVEGPSNDCEDLGVYGWLKIKDEQLAPLGIIADNNSWGYEIGWMTEGGIPVWQYLGEYFGAYELEITSPIDRISNEKNVLFVHSAGNFGNIQTFNGNEWSRHRHVFVDCDVENCGSKDEGDTDTSKMHCYSKNLSGTDCPASTCTGACETVKHDPRTPYDTINVNASGKNVLTVGALIAEGTARDITGFSSRGPARDGRVKPDVVARGFGVISPVPTNQYGTMSGTSQATPVVTGIAGLLVEQWRKSFNNATATPSPAELKALIIAGAVDIGNPGPDYTYGFGIVDAKNSVDLIIADGGKGDRIRSFDFPNGRGRTFETSMTVTEAQNVRVVLNWADPAIAWAGGDFVAEKALVNDLDLKVIDPAGNTHLPWQLNPVEHLANSVRKVNDVDNVEMVEIPNAAPGVYRIVATSSNVAEGPQKAVLVTSATLGPVVAPCRDPQEVSSSNDTPQSATQNLVPNAMVRGGLCSATDVDYFNFTATQAGPVSVAVTAKDTPVRATLTGNNVNVTIDVPANSTRTLSGVANAVPATYVLKVEAAGAAGSDSSYSFTPQFGQTSFAKRRSTGRR